MKRIQKGDKVIIITGQNGRPRKNGKVAKPRDKGVVGTVLSVKDDRVLVEGVNKVTKHEKPNSQKQTEGGIVSKEASIHISNVMLYNAATGKGDRVGFKIEDGVKYRYFKSNGQKVE